MCDNCYLGRMSLSSLDSCPWSLKLLNSHGGGKRNGRDPKLNWHCWNDMKLAAAKKPDLKYGVRIL